MNPWGSDDMAGAAGERGSFWGTLWRFRHFYLFISPFIFLFAVFGLYPLIFSLYLSFVKWDGLTAPVSVGIENFITLFSDEMFYTALWNTLLIGLLYVPPMFVLAFLFASILNSKQLRLRGIFRAGVFMPCITPMVVVAIIFSLLYSAESGLFNYLLRTLTRWLPGGPMAPIPWLESEAWSKLSVSILLVWRWTGYNMILMLAGLQGISGEYYEAAVIDGATRWQRMRHITLPLMRPTLVFCGIMSLIGTVYMFDEVFVLTQGGPGTSSTNFGLYLFNLAFMDFRFGFASSAAYTVAIAVFVVSLAVLKWRRPVVD
ncbi:MAG: carbohydrate ABC transporter permease [Candidatus Hydrogenedentales bacterium]|jgi:lactose/L-arabinose transport system permease protein